MIRRTRALSSREREEGLNYYLRHSLWNGLGVFLLNNTIISVLALSFDATNLQIGYISSVFHFAGIVLLFTPKVLAGREVQKILFRAWLYRGLVCFLYLFLFFLRGQAAVYLIMLVYTSFAVLRIVGVSMSQVVQKNLLRESEMGQAVIRLNLRMSISQIFSQLLGFIVLSFPALSGIGGLLLLTSTGASANTMASLNLKKIPSREKVEYRKGKNILKTLVESFSHRERALTLLVRWSGISVMILYAFNIAFLRRAVGMPTNMVFLYSLSGAVAAVLAASFLKPFADSIGSKPLLIVTNSGLAILALVWAFIPPDLPYAVYYVLGGFSLFLLRIWLLLSSRLFLRSIPGKERVNYTSMMNFITAVVAIIVGIAGGWLADAGIRLTGLFPHQYTPTYFFTVLLALTGTVLCIRLRDSGSLTLRETAEIFFSTKNLKAFLDVYQLDSVSDPARKETVLLSLEKSETAIADSELRNRLKSPYPGEKERILRSLFSYPRRELLPDILAEAADRCSYNRRDAVFTLGAYPEKQVRETLRGMLDDPDPAIVAIACKSLARTGSRKELPRVRELLDEKTGSPRVRIDLFIALGRMDTRGEYLRDIFRLADPENGKSFEQMIHIITARRLGVSPPLGEFFRQENIAEGRGFAELLEETRQISVFDETAKELKEAYKRREYGTVTRSCRKLLQEVNPARPLEFLREGIAAVDDTAADATTAVASLYFTHHIFETLIANVDTPA